MISILLILKIMTGLSAGLAFLVFPSLNKVNGMIFFSFLTILGFFIIGIQESTNMIDKWQYGDDYKVRKIQENIKNLEEQIEDNKYDLQKEKRKLKELNNE